MIHDFISVYENVLTADECEYYINLVEHYISNGLIIKEEKINLFKKIKSNSDNHLTKICLEGMVEGKRARGRPKRRWIDDLKDWTNLSKMYDVTKLLFRYDEIAYSV